MTGSHASERKLDIARSPVTSLIEQYNALTDVEQKVFLDLIDPQPEPEPARQTRKKRTTKSAKAQNLSNAISSSREAKAEAPQPEPLCIANVPGLNVECRDPEDNKVHDKNAGYAGYHKFEPPKPVASVTRRSSRKGAGTKFIPSTAEERVSVLSVSNGGD